MADKYRGDTSKPPKNPLLSAAGSGFPFENFSGGALLMPISQSSSSVFSEDVGEADNFLGQGAPPTASSLLAPQQPPRTSIEASQLYSPINYNQAASFPGTQRHSPFPPPEGYSSDFLSSLPPPQPTFYTPTPIPQAPFPTSTPPTPFSAPVSLTPFPAPTSQAFPAPGPQPPFPASNPNPQAPFPNTNPYFAPAANAPPQRSFPAFNQQGEAPLLFNPGSASHSPTPTPPPLVPPPTTLPAFQHGGQHGGQYGAPETSGAGLAPWASYSAPAPTQSAAPGPPPTGGANSYRLGSQKRLVYAPLPGLAVSPVTPLVAPVATSPPASTPGAHFVPAAVEPLFSVQPVGEETSRPPLPPSTFNFVPLASALTSPILTPYSPGGNFLDAMSPTQSGNSGSGIYKSASSSVADLDQSDMVLPPSFTNLAQTVMYRPVYHHWFFKRERTGKFVWKPFSMADSMALEKAFTSTEISPETKVATDGGRYDVAVLLRQRAPVYWDEPAAEVRRCSWFSKGTSDASYVPYEESVSTRLEEEFKQAVTLGQWHRRVEFPSGESVVLHGPNVIAHFPHSGSPDTWANTPPTASRPRVVKRGVDEFEIDEGEPEQVDALLFLVHGIGSACDLRFRTVEEVVNDFRTLSLQLVQSHFRSSAELGAVSRVEVLPVSWHGALHGEDTGIDRKLKSITLHSIPKLRDFTNDTLLDILFYTSPVYCQTIMETVGTEMNRIYSLFSERNPNFKGSVSLSGHSLGSLIVFDLLCHQKPPESTPEEEEQLYSSDVSLRPDANEEEGETGNDKVSPLIVPRLHPAKDPLKRRLSQKINYVMGQAGTGQPFINYPQLNFHPRAFFALGSPIGMFVTIRGIEILGEEFHLPTCPGFFNIFHPFDPVAYRIETLINPEMTAHRPVLIPHHKGRKRMHLELKETMARVGADLKQRLVESVRSTWNTVYQYAMFHRSSTGQELENEVDKVLEEQMAGHDADSCHSDGETELDVSIGRLNGGRRVDFVLQEAPLESFNEYLSAILGHLCYWESEDTMLMILKEMYGAMGISPDSQTLQHQIPLEPSSSNSSSMLNSESRYGLPNTSHFGQGPAMFPTNGDGLSEPGQFGMDPTAPIEENRNLGPPPMGGFVRKN